METLKFDTIYDIVKHIEKNYSQSNAFNYYDQGVWRNVSTQTFLYDLKRMTYGLINQGIKPGDSVGILANPSPYWTIVDFAIIMAGAISVPLFPNISDENFVYEVAQANVRTLFIEGKDQWEMFNRHRNLFDFVYSLDPSVEYERVTPRYQILKAGETLWELQPDLFDEMGKRLRPNDLMSIVYTSGSTGVPKGVEVTQSNLLHLTSFNVYGFNRKKDLYLSLLPLAHIFSRQINLTAMAWGINIYYLNDRNVIAAECKALRPSVMIVVPRILEKMYAAIMTSSEKGGKLTKTITQWALNLANNGSGNAFTKFLYRPVADWLVYSQIRRELGDNWLFILCGGATLDPHLYQFFLNIGLPIYEGWGLTEASTACVNRPGHVRVGTVGQPLPDVQIKIGTDQEVLIAGPTVTRRYYRNPDLTDDTIDEQGWFHTGDQGEMDSDGYLKITGRIKEHFKLATGEWLVPGRIEFALSQSPLIDTAVVIGERRQFAACLLFPNFTEIRKMKAMLNLADMTDDEFLESDLVKSEIKTLIENVNYQINYWERIKQYRFIKEPLKIENGEITPTLKVRRAIVLEKYQDLIDEIYKEKNFIPTSVP